MLAGWLWRAGCLRDARGKRPGCKRNLPPKKRPCLLGIMIPKNSIKSKPRLNYTIVTPQKKEEKKRIGAISSAVLQASIQHSALSLLLGSLSALL